MARILWFHGGFMGFYGISWDSNGFYGIYPLVIRRGLLRNPMLNVGFDAKIINQWWIFQQAMFDYWRVCVAVCCNPVIFLLFVCFFCWQRFIVFACRIQLNPCVELSDIGCIEYFTYLA